MKSEFRLCRNQLPRRNRGILALKLEVHSDIRDLRIDVDRQLSSLAKVLTDNRTLHSVYKLHILNSAKAENYLPISRNVRWSI